VKKYVSLLYKEPALRVLILQAQRGEGEHLRLVENSRGTCNHHWRWGRVSDCVIEKYTVHEHFLEHFRRRGENIYLFRSRCTLFFSVEVVITVGICSYNKRILKLAIIKENESE
jgi:hypothetical protein